MMQNQQGKGTFIFITDRSFFSSTTTKIYATTAAATTTEISVEYSESYLLIRVVVQPKMYNNCIS